MARGKHTREEVKQLAIDVAEQCIVEHGMQGILLKKWVML
jgi:hypothetical protein